jgi:transketolase
MSNGVNLKKRILDLSFKHRLSHVGSCLNAVDVLDSIYAKRRADDPVILSCGHAGLALYAVLEKYIPGFDAEAELLAHGTHPVKGEHIYCTTGSLGMGLTVAVGYAYACPGKTVYCVTSDGECAEGCVWEALRIAPCNLRIYLLMNGWSALNEVDAVSLAERVRAFDRDVIIVDCENEIDGLEGHYKVLNQDEYEALIRSVA